VIETTTVGLQAGHAGQNSAPIVKTLRSDVRLSGESKRQQWSNFKTKTPSCPIDTRRIDGHTVLVTAKRYRATAD
jgi:hypothetical protein